MPDGAVRELPLPQCGGDGLVEESSIAIGTMTAWAQRVAQLDRERDILDRHRRIALLAIQTKPLLADTLPKSCFLLMREGTAGEDLICERDKAVVDEAGFDEVFEDFAFCGSRSISFFAVESCTIITTDANTFMQPLHNRMPVTIEGKLYVDRMTPLVVLSGKGVVSSELRASCEDTDAS